MAKKNQINLYYIEEYNAGDIFAKFLVEQLVNARINRHDPETHVNQDIFQITGSIISDCTKEAIILGTGIILKNRKIKTFKKCYAVRGKYTLGKIKECAPDFNTDDVKLGDPGLLLSFFIEKPVEKKYDYGILLHYIDQKHINKFFTPECLEKSLIINILNNDLVDIATKMLSCKKIITSSLHGIVFSHSLKIPVSWIRLNNTSLPIDDIKFYDYLSIYDMENNTDLCCVLEKQLNYSDLPLLNEITVDELFLESKKNELLKLIVNVFREYNYEINSKFINV